MPSNPPRALAWSEQADAILRKPVDLHEIREIAAAALRVALQATTQLATWRADVRDDNDLLSPAEICAEHRGVTLHAVKRALRIGELPSRPPYPGAKRNRKATRGDVRVWVGKVLGVLVCSSDVIVWP